MATGSLQFDLTDLAGNPIADNLHILFEPSSNTGGTRMEAEFESRAATNFTISVIACRPGPGTLYRVSIDTRNYRTYSFFQMIQEGITAAASDNQIRLAIRPWRVKRLLVPPIAPALRRILPAAGSFDNLDPLAKACLLNIFAKASHNSSSGAFQFVQSLILLEQDRVFCSVDPKIEAFLVAADRFKSAPATLHKPLPGYELRNSFKSRDAHANLQITLMREVASGRMAADIDIDEASGIEHGFEVIRNYTTKKKTNPYQIHQLLLLSELDPGYQLLFG